jgi:hypothetical protein
MDAFNEHFVIALSAAGQSSRWATRTHQPIPPSSLSSSLFYLSPSLTLLLFGNYIVRKKREKRERNEEREVGKVTHQIEYKKRIVDFLHDHISNDYVDFFCFRLFFPGSY